MYDERMKKEMIVTIDGPAGSGKSTIARMAAEKRDLVYLDTGAMYRAVAYKGLRLGITAEDAAKDLDFHILKENTAYRFESHGEDITSVIRTPEIDKEVSRIAQIMPVRKLLVAKQQEYGKGKRLIVDGRDTGTVVFPYADIKIYFDASVDIRAKRRYDELQAKHIDVDYDVIKQEIEQRDYKDMHREWGALCVPPGAIVLDTSDMDREQVLTALLAVIDEYDR